MNELLLTILLSIILCLIWTCFLLLVTIHQEQRKIDRLKKQLMAVDWYKGHAGFTVNFIAAVRAMSALSTLRKNNKQNTVKPVSNEH